MVYVVLTLDSKRYSYSYSYSEERLLLYLLLEG